MLKKPGTPPRYIRAAAIPFGWNASPYIFTKVMLKDQDERERYILISHYGLDGTDARTMADIGKSMGLSRERVRQIEVGALSRLRKAI